MTRSPHGRPAHPFNDLATLRDLGCLVDGLDAAGEPTLRVVDWPHECSPGQALDLAVLPGSFNPPHTAHLALAERSLAGGVTIACYALSKQIVDKERVTGLSLADRLLLLRLIAGEQERVGVLFLNRGLYVDQAEIIRGAFPALGRLDFLVGYDKIVQIFDPRYYADRDTALDRLFTLAGFLVAPRLGKDVGDISALLDRPENRRYAPGVRILAMPPELADVSSTAVRQAAERDRLAALDEIPPLVADFIAQTGAYAPAVSLSSGERIDRYALRCQIVERLSADPAWTPPNRDVAALLRATMADTPTGRDLRATLADRSATSTQDRIRIPGNEGRPT